MSVRGKFWAPRSARPTEPGRDRSDLLETISAVLGAPGFGKAVKRAAARTGWGGEAVSTPDVTGSPEEQLGGHEPPALKRGEAALRDDHGPDST